MKRVIHMDASIYLNNIRNENNDNSLKYDNNCPYYPIA